MKQLKIKRVYDPVEPSDGTRVLVDRLWPRGLSKEHAHIDQWLKDIAPSSELRKWYGHDSGKWDEFRRRYFRELAGLDEHLIHLRELLEHGDVTLLYSARTERHNNAVALVDYLNSGHSTGTDHLATALSDAGITAGAWRDKQYLYRQGDRPRSVFWVTSGHVKLFTVSAPGDESATMILGTNRIFGAGQQTVPDTPSRDNAIAYGPTRVAVIPRERFPALLRASPVLLDLALDALFQAQHYATNRLRCAKAGARQRLCALLLDLTRSQGNVCRHGHKVDVRLTHQDLADLTAISRPVVSSILAELRRDGVIDYTRTFICIDDLEHLQQLAESTADD